MTLSALPQKKVDDPAASELHKVFTKIEQERGAGYDYEGPQFDRLDFQYEREDKPCHCHEGGVDGYFVHIFYPRHYDSPPDRSACFRPFFWARTEKQTKMDRGKAVNDEISTTSNSC